MFDKFNWKSFLYNIKSGATVPVIGNDLSIIHLQISQIIQAEKFDNPQYLIAAGMQVHDELYINLYRYLAFCLWDIYGKDEMPESLTINSVLLNLPKDSVSENEINNAMKQKISALTDDQIVLEPYRQLVRMKCFETFVTVNIDNFLERAFASENKQFNKSRNYSIPIPAIDKSQVIDPALPRVFNLMGNVESFNFALSDEQWLEYVYMLQNESDSVAKELFDAIKQKNMLLIGSSFPDWFMRFFIRIISKERFKNSLKTKYVACDNTSQDNELLLFLENNATKVIPIYKGKDNANHTDEYKDSAEFINEMYGQYRKFDDQMDVEIRYKEEVFISYCRDDISIASRIKNEFKKNGVNVFFDEETIKTGDRYNDLIKHHIKSCQFFVALISDNAIQEKSRYVYDKEWRGALFINDPKASYIRPYIIDDTAPTDPRIPEEMRELNIDNIRIEEIDKSVRKFIQENKLTPIMA